MSSPPPQQDIGDTNESLTDSSLPIDFSNSSNIKETKKSSSVEKEVISANSGKLQVSRIILNPTLAKSYIKKPSGSRGRARSTAVLTKRVKIRSNSEELSAQSYFSDGYMKSFQPILKLIDSTRSEATRSMESRSMLATATTRYDHFSLHISYDISFEITFPRSQPNTLSFLE